MVVKKAQQNGNNFRKIGAFYADVPEECISDCLIRRIRDITEMTEEDRYPLILKKLIELLGGSPKGEVDFSESELPLLCMTLSEDYNFEGRMKEKKIGYDGLELDVALALDMLHAMEQYGLITRCEVINDFNYPRHVKEVCIRPTPKVIGFLKKFQHEANDVYNCITPCRIKYKNERTNK